MDYSSSHHNYIVEQNSKNFDFKSQFAEEEQALLKIQQPYENIQEQLKHPITFRIRFITKMIIFFVIIACSLYIQTFRHFLIDNKAFMPVCGLIVVLFFTCLVFFVELRQQIPINYIMFLILTMAKGIIVAFITTKYSKQSVLLTMFLFSSLIVSLLIYSIFLQNDFSKTGFFCLFV